MILAFTFDRTLQETAESLSLGVLIFPLFNCFLYLKILNRYLDLYYLPFIGKQFLLGIYLYFIFSWFSYNSIYFSNGSRILILSVLKFPSLYRAPKTLQVGMLLIDEIKFSRIWFFFEWFSQYLCVILVYMGYLVIMFNDKSCCSISLWYSLTKLLKLFETLID